jgi:hypothetical protein
MLVQPDTAARDQGLDVKRIRGVPAQRGDQTGLRLLAEMPEPQNGQGKLLMVEQRPAAPVQGADGGDTRCRLIVPGLAPDELQHRGRNQLHGIEQRPGHLQKPDLQSHGEPVHRAAPLPNLRQSGLVQREKLLDLERGKRFREPLRAEVAVIPACHPHLYGSVSNRPPRGKSAKSIFIKELWPRFQIYMSSISDLLSVTFCTQVTRIPHWRQRTRRRHARRRHAL